VPFLHKSIEFILYLFCQVQADILPMKYKTLSSQSAQLLAYFNEKEQTFFSLSEAQTVFSDAKSGTLRELISERVKRKF
jgi:hypothetical protein